MGDTHSILLIATGSTIAGHVAADKQDEQMVRTADQFSLLVGPTVSCLNRKHNLDIQIDTSEMFNLDSFSALVCSRQSEQADHSNRVPSVRVAAGFRRLDQP
jgi:hypothetical protein